MPVDVVVQGRDQASAVLAAVSAKIASMQGTTVSANTNVVDSFKDMRQEVRLNSSAMRTLGMAYREDLGPVFQLGVALNTTGQIFSRITNAYQAYSVMQIRAEQASQGVQMAQERYNEAVQHFGPSSQQAITAGRQLQAQQQQYEQTIQQNKIATVELGVQLGTQLPLAFMQSVIAWKMYATYAGAATGTTVTFSSTLSGLASGFASAASAALPFIPTLAGIVYQVGRGTDTFNESTPIIGAFTGAIDFLLRMVDPLGSLILPKLGAAFKQTNSTMQDFGSIVGSTANSIDDLISRSAQFTQTQRGGLGSNLAYIKYMQDLAEYTQRIQFPAEGVGGRVTFTVDADTGPAQAKVSLLDSFIASIRSMFGVDADTSSAQSAINGIDVPDRTMNVYMQYTSLGIPYTPGAPGQYEQYQHGGKVPGFGPRLAVVHGQEEIRTPAQQNMTSHMTNYMNISSNMDLDLMLNKMERRLVSAWRLSA
jgi:hypothetical protein